MSDREVRTRRWSRVSLILIGILLGSMLVRPAVAQVTDWARAWTVHIRPRVVALGDSRWVRKATVQTGYFSCAGTAWESAFGGTVYDTTASLKFRTGGTSAMFRCSVELPHGATVTAARFSVKDSDPVEDLLCELWRTDMTVTVGDESPLASVSTSGSLGKVQISDTTITNAVVDNANYAYFAFCEVPSSTNAAGIYGANIEYTVSGLKGAAS